MNRAVSTRSLAEYSQHIYSTFFTSSRRRRRRRRFGRFAPAVLVVIVVDDDRPEEAKYAIEDGKKIKKMNQESVRATLNRINSIQLFRGCSPRSSTLAPHRPLCCETSSKESVTHLFSEEGMQKSEESFGRERVLFLQRVICHLARAYVSRSIPRPPLIPSFHLFQDLLQKPR